jgi:hypothetical protein
MTKQFVFCIDNRGYEFSLTVGRIYRQLPDLTAEHSGMLRVVDNEGEDYLYGEQLFIPVETTAKVRKVLDATLA